MGLRQDDTWMGPLEHRPFPEGFWKQAFSISRCSTDSGPVRSDVWNVRASALITVFAVRIFTMIWDSCLSSLPVS